MQPLISDQAIQDVVILIMVVAFLIFIYKLIRDN
jgi:hypothetical protein